MNQALIFSDSLLSAVGMSLLHSLWQIGLVALIVFVILRVLREATANSRYLVASVGLIAALLLPVITFLKLYDPEQATAEAMDSQDSLLGIAYILADSQLRIESRLDQLVLFIESLAPSVFWFWLTGMVVMAMRMSGGYYLAFRYRRRGVVQAESIWQKRLQQLAKSMQIRSKVLLLESYKTSVPMVVGLLKPCVIVPVGTLTRLPFDQVEMILAHELAHIRRADFFVNFLQSLIETILFFNPFVWWISSVIRIERENICDDMALRTTGGYLSLAKALANLSAALQSAPLTDPLITFNQLNTMKRIERLISKPKLKPTVTERISVIVFSFLFVLFITASGMLTGSNSDPVNEAEKLLRSEQTPDFKGDTIIKKSKTIEVEKKDGKIVKMLIDGKEVPQEELNKEGFEWKEADGKASKIVIMSKDDGSTTVDVDTDVSVWNDENGKTYTKKVITTSGPDGQKKNKTIMIIGDSKDGEMIMESDIIAIDGDTLNIDNSDGKIIIRSMPKGKAFIAPGGESYSFDIEVDDENIDGMAEEKQRHLIFHRKDLMTQQNELRRQADELGMQAELLRDEAEKLQATDEEAATKMREEANMLSNQAGDIYHAADELNQLGFPELPELPEAPSWTENHVMMFDTDDQNERQYHMLLRKELVRNGIIEPRSNVLISKKQLIIDNQVADKKTHKMVLKRFEDITGRKVEASEAVSLKK